MGGWGSERKSVWSGIITKCLCWFIYYQMLTLSHQTHIVGLTVSCGITMNSQSNSSQLDDY